MGANDSLRLIKQAMKGTNLRTAEDDVSIGRD